MNKLNKWTYLFYIVFGAIMIALDQLTKIFVDLVLPYQKSETIINGFFYLTYTHNYGAAWSMLSGLTVLFIAFAIVAVCFLGYTFLRTKENEILTRFGIVLVASGAIGNVLDRILYGYVRDFLDFMIFGYDFPIFNVADMAICIGVFLIFLEMAGQEVEIWKQSK